MSSSEQAANASAAKAISKSFSSFVCLSYLYKIKNPVPNSRNRIPVLHSPAHTYYICRLHNKRPTPSATVRSAPFSAEPVRKSRILPPGDARQVFWLVPAATPSRPEPVAKECAAIDGTYSSGNCCRFTRHSHLITRGLARPFVNHCGAKLGNKFVSLPSLTKI